MKSNKIIHVTIYGVKGEPFFNGYSVMYENLRERSYGAFYGGKPLPKTVLEFMCRDDVIYRRLTETAEFYTDEYTKKKRRIKK